MYNILFRVQAFSIFEYILTGLLYWNKTPEIVHNAIVRRSVLSPVINTIFLSIFSNVIRVIQLI